MSFLSDIKTLAKALPPPSRCLDSSRYPSLRPRRILLAYHDFTRPQKLIHEPQPLKNTASNPTKRKCKTSRKESDIWNYFVHNGEKKDPKATCVFCDKSYAADKSRHGTTSLWNHLLYLCPLSPCRVEDPKQKKLSFEPQDGEVSAKLRAVTFNMEDYRKALAKMVMVDEKPFRVVEGEGFRNFVKILQPMFNVPSRVTVRGIFTLTVDNATSNNGAISYLKRKIKDWKGTILDHKYIHLRCCAHIVNLIVKEGLDEHFESIQKIRKAVKYVKSSPKRLLAFKDCVEKEKIKCKSLLCLDVETRWNSTYLMLECAEKFEKAFERLGDIDRDYQLYFCGSDGETRLNEVSNSCDHELKIVAEGMKMKFEKYWENSCNLNLLLYIAVVLDPRYKLKYVKFWLEKMYPVDIAYGLIIDVNHAMETLYADYFQHHGKVNSSADGGAAMKGGASSSSNEGQSSMDVDDENYSKFVKSQFKRHLMEEECVENKSEVTMYLAEPCDNGDERSFDILAWWKVNASRYPILSLIAKDVLAMSVSTVPSESAFSTGGRILDPFRSSLSPKTVETLVLCKLDIIQYSTRLQEKEVKNEDSEL
ncbi:hypothetical protein LUZ61_001076 [Rhynchospora tenuis]|uniref:BED-type domain-containing protein n=1 Tax=Rhynchospora tenuis TaxID=198213 RepID=A0AAD5ZGJ6_9POAL|nr:hypothetical protein LUZ61_001076 [Rhynchospora tenuis]